MGIKTKERSWYINAFLLLVAISAYRQFSMHFLPGDFIRPYLVYSVYLILIFGWVWSVLLRITQKNMKVFLISEGITMFIWMTVRFIQDAFLQNYIYFLRISGYLIFVPAISVPLLGLYASFGLGREEEFHFSKKWYLLLLPASALLIMALTNEVHQFVYYNLPGEEQPNISFHPNTGLYVIFLWVLFLVAFRVIVIYKRNGRTRRKSFLSKLVPFSEILLLIVFCTPYTLASFYVRYELLEFSAGLFFIEIISWEMCIYAGLIPVNVQYRKVFDLSTVAMRIVTREGVTVLGSQSAPSLKADEFQELKEKKCIPEPDGRELHMHEISGGFLIWQKDVSAIRAINENLAANAQELEQESQLLGREIRVKSEESSVLMKNRIYNQLTDEVQSQLVLLEHLLAEAEESERGMEVLPRIGFIGTYVKRRCNLRLIQLSGGKIDTEDVALCFRDLTEWLRIMKIKSDISLGNSWKMQADFALAVLDGFEQILEREDFQFSAVSGGILSDGTFAFELNPGNRRFMIHEGK